MTDKRMAEATINDSLDAYLHGAEEGDPYQARHLHEMLDLMLTEREIPAGPRSPRRRGGRRPPA